MKLKIEKSVVVITPTIGLPDLTKAVESVRSQSYKNIKHLLVVDGMEYYNENIKKFENDSDITIMTLPFNTGKNGYNGQRIYSSVPHLLDQEYVLFLDEDNWWDYDHVSTLVDKIETDNLEWAYSLRKVYIHPEKLLAYDNCESIGRWPIWFTKNNNEQFLVDTSSYCFTRKFIINTCHLWHSGAWGEDRRYFYAIKNKSKYDTTGMHTLNYRLPDMEKAYGGDYSFFEKGNAEMFKQYDGGYPWLSRT